MNRKLITIIFLILVLLAAVFLALRPVILFNRAYSPASSSKSLENSYLFASPIQAKADSRQLIRITVFLLNSQGLGIPNAPVSLKTDPALNLIPVQPQTDQYGKAVFDISSSAKGKFSVSASTAGQNLPQTVSILFY